MSNDLHTNTGGERLNNLFGILRSSRRRLVLAHLREADGGPIQLGHLADLITEEENDHPSYPETNRKAVYVGLYQTHIPRMEEEGLVTVGRPDGAPDESPSSGPVSLTDTDNLALVLDVLDHAYDHPSMGEIPLESQEPSLTGRIKEVIPLVG